MFRSLFIKLLLILLLSPAISHAFDPYTYGFELEKIISLSNVCNYRESIKGYEVFIVDKVRMGFVVVPSKKILFSGAYDSYHKQIGYENSKNMMWKCFGIRPDKFKMT